MVFYRFLSECFLKIVHSFVPYCHFKRKYWQHGGVVNSPVFVITWSRFKTFLRHSVLSVGKTLYSTFSYLVVWASSSKFQSYLYKIKN